VIVNNVLMANANNPVYVYNDAGWRRRSALIQIKNNVFAQNAGNCVTSPQPELVRPAQHVHGERESDVHQPPRSWAFSISRPATTTREWVGVVERRLPGYATNDYVERPDRRPARPTSGAFEALVGGGPDVDPAGAIRDLSESIARRRGAGQARPAILPTRYARRR